MKSMRTRKNDVSKGFSLAELLVGLVLFSIILTLSAAGLSLSRQALVVSKRQLPVEIVLQNAMDSATRLIRESADVSGGQTSIMLTRWGDNNSMKLTFANSALWFGPRVLQEDLKSANFQVVDGEVTKYVVVTLTAESLDPNGAIYPKTLTSSVSLRGTRVALVRPTLPPPPAQTSPLPAQTPPPPQAQTQTPPLPLAQIPPAPKLFPMVVMGIRGGSQGIYGSLGHGGGNFGGGVAGDFDMVVLTTQGLRSTENSPYLGPAPLKIFMLPAPSAHTAYPEVKFGELYPLSEVLKSCPWCRSAVPSDLL